MSDASFVTASGPGRPVPTLRALGLLALAMVPAVLSMRGAHFAWLAVGWDLFVLLLCVLDYVLAPGVKALRVGRRIGPVLSSGVVNPVTLELEASPGQRPLLLRGELRDLPPPHVHSEGHHQRFSLHTSTLRQRLTYRLTPSTRGRVVMGDVHVRLEGPLGLCSRQLRFPLTHEVKVYPDLTALTKDALTLARTSEHTGRPAPKREEGREFDSLRDYRPGDPVRTLDWKATARRGKPIVREQRPEQNQTVLLLLDCGRHMAGVVRGRRKLDHAVDAALRLAKVSLDSGDAVGVVAFGTRLRAQLPPRRGLEQLRSITHALHTVEAELEESDYGAAVDAAFSRQHRRSLVVVFTDLQDPFSSRALLERTLALRPRHLPLVASLVDDDVRSAIQALPEDVLGAYVRPIAARLEDDYRLAVSRLESAGALALRETADAFGPRTVNTYLRLKARGAL